MQKNIKFIRLNPISCLIYTRLLNHKLNIQSSFKFGEIAFIQNEQLFWGELESLESLHKDLIWDKIFFQNLDQLIMSAKIGIIQQQEYSRVIKIQKQGKIIFQTVVKYQVGKDVKKFLFDQNRQYIKQKSKFLTILRLQNQSQKALFQQNQQILQKQQIKSQEQKQILISKLSALYVTKKNRLRQVQEDDSQFNPSQTSQVAPLPQEFDIGIGATFFMQSQNFR